MTERPNISRFDFESNAFKGWRLSITRSKTHFSHYFSDAKFGGSKQSLAAAEKALEELKAVVEDSRRVNKRLTGTTIKKVEIILAAY